MGNGGTDIWARVSAALDGPDHSTRMRGLCAAVSDVLEGAGCRIYRADDDRLVLEVQAGGGGEESWSDIHDAVSDIVDGDAGSGGASAALGSAQIVLGEDPSQLRPTVVQSGDRWLAQTPLPGPSGTVAGLCETGPFDSQRRARRILKRSEPLAAAVGHGLASSRRQDALEREIEALEVKCSINRSLVGSSLHAARTHRLLLSLAMSACRSDTGLILRRSGDVFEEVAAENLPTGFLQAVDLTPGSGVLELTPDGEGVMVIDAEPIAALGVTSLVAVPIGANAESGLIALMGLRSEAQLVETSGEVLEQFARQIELTMRNEELERRFVESSWQSLVGLARTLDSRFSHTEGHHQLVARLACAIGERVGLGEDEVRAVTDAALVHDVGMAGLVDTDAAFEAGFQHPNTGADLIEIVAGSQVADVVRSHHEWYSGYGFPNGRKGDETTLEGYVLGAAEYLAEASAPIAGAEPLGLTELLAEVEERSGDQLHPECAAAAREVITEPGAGLPLVGGAEPLPSDGP